MSKMEKFLVLCIILCCINFGLSEYRITQSITKLDRAVMHLHHDIKQITGDKSDDKHFCIICHK